MVNQIVTVKQTFRILMLTFFACFIRKQKFWVEWNELIRVSLWLGVTVQGCALTRICHMSKNNLEDFQLDLFPVTVFPRIVSAETILFWKLDCDHYSREETIQGRKAFFYSNFCIQFYFSPLNNSLKYYYITDLFRSCIPNFA